MILSGWDVQLITLQSSVHFVIPIWQLGLPTMFILPCITQPDLPTMGHHCGQIGIGKNTIARCIVPMAGGVLTKLQCRIMTSYYIISFWYTLWYENIKNDFKLLTPGNSCFRIRIKEVRSNAKLAPKFPSLHPMLPGSKKTNTHHKTGCPA